MPLLYPIFFLIAAVYATAGFGGGSSYLAVLALWSVPTDEMRLIALTCNIIVAGGGVLHFARAGELPWRAALPLVLASVPCAYLGGAGRAAAGAVRRLAGGGVVGGRRGYATPQRASGDQGGRR